MRALAPMIAALAGLTIAVGCGEPEDVGPASSVAAPPPPVPPSALKPSETVDEAGERIAEVIAGGDCDRISELVPLAAQATGAAQAQCDVLAPLEGFAPRRAAAYGGGAVIGFEKDDAQLSVVLVLDVDGLYHLVGLDAGDPGVGTPLSPGFERPAAAAVGALRDKDCGAFRMSALALSGVGASEQACDYVRNSAFGQALGTDPSAEPVLSGGNSRYAFYIVRAPSARFTMVLARDPRAGTSELPEGAPPYGFVDAHQTGTGTLPAPRRRESAAELETRVRDVASSGDCELAYSLNPLSRRPAFDVPDQCRGLQTLDDYASIGSRAFPGGAVIDYESERGQRPSAVFILDADGLHHLALIDGFKTTPSADTPFDPGFDKIADAAADALRAKDCDAFGAVAASRYGPGANREALCDYVTTHPLSGLLAANPLARPIRLGGNRDYALYAVSTPEASFTMVLSRQRREAILGTPALPAGTPELAFVDAYETSPTLASAGD